MEDIVSKVNDIMYAAQEAQDTVLPGFRITDDGMAEWAVRKISEAKAEKAKMQKYYAGQMRAIEERCGKTEAFFTGALMEYFNSVPRRATKTGIEKYALPSGELVRRPAGIEYRRDEDALLNWCKSEHPEFVKVKESASWSEIKAYMKETGEVPKGVTAEEKEPEFEVKVKEMANGQPEDI